MSYVLLVDWFISVWSWNTHPATWIVLGISTWVLTTPVRSVAWVVLDSLRLCIYACGLFYYFCGDRYLTAVRSEQMATLSSPDYAWAAISLLFLVPIAVLEDHEAEFGSFGRKWSKLCDATHHTLFEFLPDTLQSSWNATVRYGQAFGEAWMYVAYRASDGCYGGYIGVTFVAAGLVHGPRVLYDVLEGLLHGPVGVAVALTVWCVWYEFDTVILRVSLAVLACGLYSRLLRSFEVRVLTGTPTCVMNAGVQGMQQRVSVREKEEAAIIGRLRGVTMDSVPAKNAVEKDLECGTITVEGE
ncbi:hypothetical protein PHMEG_00037226 [Phytophthora megakarya]|uniref:Transmembrane protein n=1 Tax=Phytophthora megakarya TaxID=4795 RepID=A0A225UK43_9STRA|nr:hypothetical protein PHMEG_00037226 [Phytophthora megakarya]